MSVLISCGCGQKISAQSRNHASDEGWVFVDILTKEHVKYLVMCAACAAKARWLAMALHGAAKQEKADG